MRNYCEDLMYADWPKWSNLGGKISTVVSIVSGFVGCLIGTAIGCVRFSRFIFHAQHPPACTHARTPKPASGAYRACESHS
mmetsp:Transcript_38670/g.121123  ORF Transcript_38670/g.121123 Transcript_38670/m.121123 type:complete len:81 (+) Transcript_38670:116-358(+)